MLLSHLWAQLISYDTAMTGLLLGESSHCGSTVSCQHAKTDSMVQMVYMQQRAKPLHLWRRNNYAGRPQPTRLAVLRQNLWPKRSQRFHSRAAGLTVSLHKRVKITQIRREKTTPRLLLLVRKHLRGPRSFDILMNGEVRTETSTARASGGVWIKQGEAHSVSCMGDWGREAKYLQCTRRKSFPGFQTLSLWGTVQSSEPGLHLASGPIHKLIVRPENREGRGHAVGFLLWSRTS